jgi:3-oxoacyl-[acyl-carrier protein] reductase
LNLIKFSYESSSNSSGSSFALQKRRKACILSKKMRILMTKTALITGGSRGIGRAIAQHLASNGFDTAIVYVSSQAAAEETVEFCRSQGVRSFALQADISSPQDRRRIVETLKDEFGRLDLLVNNAGVSPLQRLDLLEATEESYDRVMTINLKAPYFLTQAVANWMIPEKKRDDAYQPRIVNISSISAYTSSPSRGEYCLSKAALSMMTQLYADRLAEFDIPVYEIRPGIIATDMTAAVAEKYDKLILEEGLTPIRHWGHPQDVAQAVLAIALGYLPYSTGQVLNIDGGFHLRRL